MNRIVSVTTPNVAWLGRRSPVYSLSVLRPILAILAIVLAILMGMAVPTFGIDAVLAPTILFGALMVLVHPLVGMLLIAATIPLESLVVLEGEITFTRVLGIGVFGIWFARKLVLRESWQPLLSSGLLQMTFALLGLTIASALWSDFPSTTFSGASQLFRLILLALLVADLAKTWPRIEWLVLVLLAAGFAAAVLTLFQYFSGSASSSGRAGAEIAGGINATAMVLVTLVPFAFYLIRANGSPIRRIIGVLYVTVASFAVIVTFSRAGLLVLSAAILFGIWQTFRGSSGRRWLLLSIGFAILAALVVIPQSDIEEQFVSRVQSVLPYIESSFSENDIGALSARGYHAKVGLAIFSEHPIIGAGYESYGELFLREYQFRIPGARTIWGSARSPHGSYIGFLATLGLIGIALWVGIILLAFRNLIRARTILAQYGPEDPARLVESVGSSLMILVLYGFSTDVHEQKILWIVLGLSAACLSQATQMLRKDTPQRSLMLVEDPHLA